MNRFREKLAVFMRNLRSNTYRFMYGRYGVDELYHFLSWTVLVLIFIQFFVRSSVLLLIEMALLIFSMFRFFSKNINQRRKENDWYLARTKTIRKKIRDIYRSYRDRKVYRYRKCPNCQQTLRLPYRKGTHNVRCPKCGHTFETKI